MATQSDMQHLDGVKSEYQYGFHDEEKAFFKSRAWPEPWGHRSDLGSEE